MVAGYQRRPPWAVGMRSAFSPSAIAARLEPAARSSWIRSSAHGDIVGGRPSPDPPEPDPVVGRSGRLSAVRYTACFLEFKVIVVALSASDKGD